MRAGLLATVAAFLTIVLLVGLIFLIALHPVVFAWVLIVTMSAVIFGLFWKAWKIFFEEFTDV